MSEITGPEAFAEEEAQQEAQLERVVAQFDTPNDPAQESPVEPDLPPDRKLHFAYTSFSRMRTEWDGADQVRLQQVEAVAADIIKAEFAVAFAVIERIRRKVRIPAVDPASGEVQAYPDGTPRWETDEFGVPVEHWDQLRDSDIRNLMGTIASFLFEWESAATDKWARALFSKVQWEEIFARGFRRLPNYDVAGRPTIQDRTQFGHDFASAERYFAVFHTYVSKKADAVVQSMTRMYRLLERMLD